MFLRHSRLGYTIAERMEILPRLRELGYAMERMKMVGPDGEAEASMNLEAVSRSMNGRFVSLPRGDIAATLFEACGDVEARFGTSVDTIEESSSGVIVTLSDGSREQFDLVVGADGLHSRIRELAFVGESECEHRLGCSVAALQIAGYRPRDELTYVAHTVPGRQVARFSLREDETIVLMIVRDEHLPSFPETLGETKAVLRRAFGDLAWEVPHILDCMDDAQDVYFDRVSQIRLDRWTRGRVALVGDAAACVSLLAGEGTGLAIVEAYVLAGELERCRGDHVAAFRNYEERLRGFLADKQKSASRNIGFFVPKTRAGQWIRDRMVNLASRPFVADRLARAFEDDIELPEYERGGG